MRNVLLIFVVLWVASLALLIRQPHFIQWLIFAQISAQFLFAGGVYVAHQGRSA